MGPSARLYQCMLCHKQVLICSFCDRGQIYCSKVCSSIARKQSQKLSAVRYQKTLNGKLHHAARQARYRYTHKKIVTHQGSPALPSCDSIGMVKKSSDEIKSNHVVMGFVCCFCKKPVSVWIRCSFLRRRDAHKRQAFPQPP